MDDLEVFVYDNSSYLSLLIQAKKCDEFLIGVISI